MQDAIALVVSLLDQAKRYLSSFDWLLLAP